VDKSKKRCLLFSDSGKGVAYFREWNGWGRRVSVVHSCLLTHKRGGNLGKAERRNWEYGAGHWERRWLGFLMHWHSSIFRRLTCLRHSGSMAWIVFTGATTRQATARCSPTCVEVPVGIHFALLSPGLQGWLESAANRAGHLEHTPCLLLVSIGVWTAVFWSLSDAGNFDNRLVWLCLP